MNNEDLNQENITEICNEARELIKAGKHNDAIIVLNQAIENKKTSGLVFLILGQIYDEIGKKDEAISTYKKGIKKHPDFVDNYFDIAVMYSEQANTIRQNLFNYPIGQLAETAERAIEYFLKAAYLGDSEAKNILNERGISASIKKEFISELKKIGDNRVERNNIEEAKSIFLFIEQMEGSSNNLIQESIDKLSDEEKETRYTSYLNCVNLLRGNKGHTQQQIDSIKNAIKLIPNRADAYWILGECLRDNGKNEEAMESYSKALEYLPDGRLARHIRSTIERLKTNH